MVDRCKPTIGGLQPSPQFVNDCDVLDDAFPYADIGRRLEALRTGFSDLTQKAWAEKHGFNPTQYNNWAKGSRRIPVEAAEKLCDRYGLTLDAIYRGKVDGLSETARKLL